jgi:hypothetical protein
LLKARVAGRYYAALDADAPWAIQMGMRNLFAWDAGRSGFQVNLVDGDNPGEVEKPFVELRFVVPNRPAIEPPRDVTPRKPITPDTPRDYSVPEDPVILEARANPPSSGVPLVGGKKRGPGDWMG